VAYQGPDQPNPPVNGDPSAIIPGKYIENYKEIVASDPTPADGAIEIPVSTTLSWTPGVDEDTEIPYTAQHVYFGTDAAAVAAADTTSPEYKGTATGNSYGPANVDYLQTAYWRIDGETGGTIYKGNVWSYRGTFNPADVGDPDLMLWYKFDGDALDSSGHGRHGVVAGAPTYGPGQIDQAIDMVGAGGTGDRVETEMTASQLGIAGNNPRTVTAWVYTRAFNDGGIFDVGNRAATQDFCLRTLGTVNMWRVQYWGGDSDFEYPGYFEWVHFGHVHDGINTKIYADGKLVVDWAKTIDTPDTNPFHVGCYGWNNDHFDGVIDDFRLYDRALSASEVMKVYRQNLARAWNPNPANLVADVGMTPVLTWTPGDYAPPTSGHYVYFGADDPANMALVANQPQGPNSYDPGTLDLGRTYYWVVDEANTSGGVDAGQVWSFTTTNNLLVDDMETYTNWKIADNNIFEVWVDGMGNCRGSGNGTGANVFESPGNGVGGFQAMEFNYDNDGMVENPCLTEPADEPRELLYSEAEADVGNLPSGVGSDWTTGGVKALSLMFYGATDNALEPMWIKLTDASDNSFKVLYGTGPGEAASDLEEASWHEWNIALADFIGVNLADIKSIAIGVGNEGSPLPGGSGTLYFDEIRLYTPRCVLDRRSADYALVDYAPESTGGNCVVNHFELEIMARDWLMGDKTVVPTAPPSGNLVLYYQFEADATDSSGNGRDGTENGGPLHSGGKIGQGIELDGADDYVSTTYNAGSLGIGGNNPRTVTAWVYTRAFNDGGIWDIGNHSAGQDFCLRTLTTDNLWRIQYWGGDVTNTGPGTGDFDFSYPTLNEWVHVAHVHDGTNTIVYMNGEEVVNIPRTLSTEDNNPLYVGTYGWPSSYFDGLIDDFRLWDKGLTHGEVLYTAGMPTTYVPVGSPANVSDLETVNQKKVNFLDYAELMLRWLDEELWP